jgi:hypothetical protein
LSCKCCERATNSRLAQLPGSNKRPERAVGLKRSQEFLVCMWS